MEALHAPRIAFAAFAALTALLVSSPAARAVDYQDLLVNTTVSGDQQDPDIAMAGGGGSLIVWVSQPYSSSAAILGRLYDDLGGPVSGEIQLSPTGSGARLSPHVCSRDIGGWVVVWTAFPPGSGYSATYAQLLAPDATAVGGPQLLTSGNQDAGVLYSDVACLPGGGFVAVWTTHELGGYSEVIGRRYDADGSPAGGRFFVSETDHWVPSDAAIESDTEGRSLVVWSAGCPFYWVDCPTGPDGSDAATLARLYNADGSPAGSEFIVNSFTEGSQGATGFAAAFGDDGGFMVTFTSGDFDWPTAMTVCGHMPCGLLRARRFAADGTPIGDDFPASENEPGDHLHPTIAADGANGFLLMWELEQEDLYARVFGPDNIPVTDQILFHDADGYARIPRLASLGGKFHATWQSGFGTRDVQHQTFTSLSGEPEDPVDPEPPVFECPTLPAEDCSLANPGTMRIRTGGSSAILRWKWRDEPGDPAEVDAMLAGVTLCMYRDGVLVDRNDVPAITSESGAAMWQSRTNRWNFARAADGLFGVRKMKISRRPDQSRFALQADSPNTDLMRSSSPILIQLFKSDGSCWQPPGL